MKVYLKRVKGTWAEILDKCRVTVNKEDKNKEPKNSWKKNILLAEHSPIRCMTFDLMLEEIPYFVSTHICRHHIGIEKWVSTSRSDRTGIDRHGLPQDNPVNMEIEANTQALINIARKRLCKQASKETQEVMREIKKAVGEKDPMVASVMAPECVYRGFCPELKSCGYVNTEEYKEEVKKYRDKE